MRIDAGGPELVVADEVDEFGVIDFQLNASDRVVAYGGLTIRQAEALAYALLALVDTERKKESGMVWREDARAGSHWCPEPLDEPCYWSGDPYACHGVGF